MLACDIKPLVSNMSRVMKLCASQQAMYVSTSISEMSISRWILIKIGMVLVYFFIKGLEHLPIFCILSYSDDGPSGRWVKISKWFYNKAYSFALYC